MADDQNKITNSDTNVDERPLDPSGNYGDMIGDTQGQTGVTVGSAQQSSAEPSDTGTDVDTANLPGGIQAPSGSQTQPTGIPKTAQNDKAYNQSVGQTMSSTSAKAADDTGSYTGSGAPSTNPADPQTLQKATDDIKASNQASDEDTMQSDQPVTQVTNATPPNVQGEQSVSGTTPDVESDDDTLQNAHAVGFQPNEDLEHPQELNAARDIDKAEQSIKNS